MMNKAKKRLRRPQTPAARKLRLGLPKGSLQEAAIQKMAKAGFNIAVSSRSYIPYVDDEELEVRLIRAQEISRYVEHGYLDCGITGHDWIHENGSNVYEVGEFVFSKATSRPARWVLCVPEASPIQKPEELAQYVMEDLDPDFKNRYQKGDFIVAGKNFGCGSSREHAPWALLDYGFHPAGGSDTLGTQNFATNPMFSIGRQNVGLTLAIKVGFLAFSLAAMTVVAAHGLFAVLD